MNIVLSDYSLHRVVVDDCHLTQTLKILFLTFIFKCKGYSCLSDALHFLLITCLGLLGLMTISQECQIDSAM